MNLYHRSLMICEDKRPICGDLFLLNLCNTSQEEKQHQRYWNQVGKDDQEDDIVVIVAEVAMPVVDSA